MKVVFPDKLPLAKEHLDELHKLVDLEVYSDIPQKEELIKRIKDANVITANYVDITSDVVNTAESLKTIIVPAVGFEWVDWKYSREKSIDVINCPTHNTHAVAEHTIGLMFAVTRKIVQSNLDLKEGKWRSINTTGVELKGKEVLLFGRGNIGSKTEKMLINLEMKVNIVDSKTEPLMIDNYLKSADFVVLNVPLNSNTKHLIDKRRISLLKKSAFLINTARGAIVDQNSLEAALKDGEIAGAALDVFEGEPLTGNPSEEMLRIVKLPNVVATPHIGYDTKETEFRLGLELIENVKSLLAGKPINVVN